VVQEGDLVHAALLADEMDVVGEVFGSGPRTGEV
jgi:hypothetical protein